jgi:hypothetical protein
MQAFLDALNKRSIFPAGFRSREWAAVAPAIRQRSFFSATVSSARVLTRWRSMLLDWLEASTEEVVTPTGETVTAYKEVGLAKFRERAADLLISEGLATKADFKNTSISNPVSNARLQLVFTTNIEQAQEFAYWQQRIQDEDYLNRYPAAEFIRRPGGNPEYFRPLHIENTGQIRRWDDWEFWLRMNSREIGGFSVPWGPWGFNSYMAQIPVRRAKAESLGLVRKGERIKVPDLTRWGVEPAKRLNAGLEADLKDVTPEIKEKAVRSLTDRFGPGAVTPDGKVTLDTLRRARAALG